MNNFYLLVRIPNDNIDRNQFEFFGWKEYQPEGHCNFTLSELRAYTNNKAAPYYMEAALIISMLNDTVIAQALGDWSDSPQDKTATFYPRTLA